MDLRRRQQCELVVLLLRETGREGGEKRTWMFGATSKPCKPAKTLCCIWGRYPSPPSSLLTEPGIVGNAGDDLTRGRAGIHLPHAVPDAYQHRHVTR